MRPTTRTDTTRANIIVRRDRGSCRGGRRGTLFIPKDALRQYISELTDFPGLTGTLTCDENGDCGSEDVSVAQVVDGAFSEIWTTRAEVRTRDEGSRPGIHERVGRSTGSPASRISRFIQDGSGAVQRLRRVKLVDALSWGPAYWHRGGRGRGRYATLSAGRLSGDQWRDL